MICPTCKGRKKLYGLYEDLPCDRCGSTGEIPDMVEGITLESGNISQHRLISKLIELHAILARIEDAMAHISRIADADSSGKWPRSFGYRNALDELRKTKVDCEQEIDSVLEAIAAITQ